LPVKNRPLPIECSDPFKNNKELLTDPLFLIGNGKSRENFDLERLRSIGTIIGCNAIFREFTPDLLIAIDAKMLKELKDSKYTGTTLIPKNRTKNVPKAIIWKAERFNTSGCFAMKLISQVMKPSKCYMLGMDGYPGNMYDGTINYAPNTLQNFSGVNGYYLKTLREGGETTFINVNFKDAWPKEARDTGRYEFMPYTEFEETIMCTTK